MITLFKIRALSNVIEKSKMAETPTTRAKKRAMDETPPKVGELYKILSPGGTVTLGSPQEDQDQKKRVTADEKPEENTNKTLPTRQLSATPQGQGQVIQTNMADDSEKNKPTGTDEKPNAVPSGPEANEGDEIVCYPAENTDGQVPKRGRAPARRGRPRKRALSLEPIVDRTDLMSAILGICGDIGHITENQETLKGEMIKSLDSKIDELKQNICGEVTETKKPVETNEIHIDKLRTSQDRQQLKTTDLQHKQDDFAKDLMLHKRYLDDINLALSDQLGTVELGLAQDLETLMCNVEQNVANARGNHNELEQKLKDYTIELDIETGRLKMDMEAMRKVVDKLHPQNLVLDKLSSELERNSLKTSCSSCQKCSTSNTSDLDTDSFSKSSECSDIGAKLNGQSLCMFGDTTRTVIIVDRVAEKEGENLKRVLVDCFHDIHLNIEEIDIEKIERIGVFVKNKRWPRPVKITFYDQATRDQVLFFKTRLKHSTFFYEFQFSKEEPKDIRAKRTKLGQAAIIARQRGHDVHELPDRIIIDKVEYDLGQIDQIPKEFEVQKPITQSQRRSSMNFYDKCTTKTENVIMVGPSLQRTIRGLVFCSASCFLSNFCLCDITYRGEKYNCLEQGYQATKAIICNDDAALRIIMGTVDQV